MPLVLFVAIVWLSYLGLGLEDRDKLPSALIGKPFPNFEARSLFDVSANIGSEQLIGRPTLVNVWATWCIACRIEHPFLMKLKDESSLTIYGLNYKDNKEKALELLRRDGNPFEFSIYDFEGRLAIDLGVYGAPETFFIDKNGFIRERHVGVIDEKVWKDKFAKYLDE